MSDQILDLHLNDFLVLKKKHPCGSFQWEVVRLGADIGLLCKKCGRRQLMARSALRQRLKSIDHSSHDVGV